MLHFLKSLFLKQPFYLTQGAIVVTSLAGVTTAIVGVSSVVTQRRNAFPQPTAYLRGEFQGLGEEAAPDTTLRLRFGNANANALHIKHFRLSWEKEGKHQCGTMENLSDDLKLDNTVLSSASDLGTWERPFMGSTMVVLATFRPKELTDPGQGRAWYQGCRQKFKDHKVCLEIEYASPGWFGGIDTKTKCEKCFFLPPGAS
eukprot:m.292982 g.292982  ORF g.292982 m.292982 type:complete len:201 (-) comp17868_c0_seq1:2329-2931(-)